MGVFITWYIAGLIGCCMLEYVDMKRGTGSLVAAIFGIPFAAVFGGIMLLVGLAELVIYLEEK